MKQIEIRNGEIIAKENFRLWVAGGFGLLVALLIFGLLLVALFKKDMANAIFGTGSGLQFVALFLILIIVGMFGVSEILGDKELAAILAAIAGYILGRSQTGTDTTQNGDSGTPQPAPGNPASGS
ncbi:MAG: hypothetical protein GDA49_09060 [Rhodospirillales bacterium]|nr:hypothetical protein [Rhodospirillales bacterium]